MPAPHNKLNIRACFSLLPNNHSTVSLEKLDIQHPVFFFPQYSLYTPVSHSVLPPTDPNSGLDIWLLCFIRLQKCDWLSVFLPFEFLSILFLFYCLKLYGRMDKRVSWPRDWRFPTPALNFVWKHQNIFLGYTSHLSQHLSELKYKSTGKRGSIRDWTMHVEPG